MNPLLEAKALGQNFWLDNLSRTLLREGSLKKLIEQDGISGITSNPSIFHKAISSGSYYQADLDKLKTRDLTTEQAYEQLVISDIQEACHLLKPVYDASLADDGYVSLEVSPWLAYEEQATIDAATRLRALVNCRNLLIKVPATSAGVRAFEKLTAKGINVNVTLMFSLRHVMEIAQAYIRGVREWVKNGGDAHQIKSVASVFLSRVDSLVDKQLEQTGNEQALSLRGRAAVSMAKLAYQRYKDIFYGAPFKELRKMGARPQYLLWGSTGTKNPHYSDLLYVEPLIGPETINTLPDATLAAFRDHGEVALTLEQGVHDAEKHLVALEQVGVDLREIGETLQQEGVKLFDESYNKLLGLLKPNHEYAHP